MPNIEVVSARDVPGFGGEERGRPLAAEVTWVSPLDVLFSQNVVYPKFTDGRSVDEALKEIRAVVGSGSGDGVEDAAEVVVLEPPFPAIEAVRWCPKLRDGQGRPLPDGQGGHRRGTEGLFSVDNRRLYALQRAAVAQWPRRCAAAVSVIVDRTEVLKHLKKFRTRTNGLSITVTEWSGVGRDNARAFSAMRVWDWRSAVARAEEGGAEAVVAAADAGSCGCWEYLDNQDVCRGPFSNWQMRQWWERKMLPPSLRVRAYDAAAAAGHGGAAGDGDGGFRPVAEVFAEAPAPFAPGSSPRATDVDAEWRLCAQCGRQRWEGWAVRGEWYCATCWQRWQKGGDGAPAPPVLPEGA